MNLTKNILYLIISLACLSSCKVYDELDLKYTNSVKCIVKDNSNTLYYYNFTSLDTQKISGIATPSPLTSFKASELKEIYDDTSCILIKVKSSLANNSEFLKTDIKRMYIYTEKESFDLGKRAVRKLINGKVYVFTAKNYELKNLKYTKGTISGSLSEIDNSKEFKKIPNNTSLTITLKEKITLNNDFEINYKDENSNKMYLYNSRKSFLGNAGLVTLGTFLSLLISGVGNPGS